ncbi:response regulator transcription factor [Fulvivirga maritima]|uniref:response regulator transcription factor n=1 Tax=Fulvivirga maritima TaxID=2904247 RepID=UPI001F303475|nr:response regulator transcription factor [Fulvivirga maritima]UII25874.1 response regulator transcription factor [Fulvivirga maritima]
MEKISIIIIDDHKIFLEGISSLLEDVPNFEIIGTAGNDKEAYRLLEEHQINLVICDISMPEINGLDLCVAIKKKYPDTNTLILSSHGDIQSISRGVKYEVDGYLLKNTAKDELIKAIETIHNGGNYFSKDVKDLYIKNAFERKSLPEQPRLSKKEIGILRLIAEEYTTQEIADKIFISQNTVNTHRRNLLTKLNVKNTAGLVRYAVENQLLD